MRRLYLAACSLLFLPIFFATAQGMDHKEALVEVFADAIFKPDAKVILAETYLTINQDLPHTVQSLARKYNLTPFYALDISLDPASAKVIFLANFLIKPGAIKGSWGEIRSGRPPAKFFHGTDDGCYLLIVTPVDAAKLLPVRDRPKKYSANSEVGLPEDKTPLSDAIVALSRETPIGPVYEFAGDKSGVRLGMPTIIQPIKQPVPRIQPGPGAKPWTDEQRRRVESLTYKAAPEFASDLILLAGVISGFTEQTPAAEKSFKISACGAGLKSEEGSLLLKKLLEKFEPPVPPVPADRRKSPPEK